MKFKIGTPILMDDWTGNPELPWEIPIVIVHSEFSEEPVIVSGQTKAQALRIARKVKAIYEEEFSGRKTKE
jgi:hypothetical protein